MVGGRGTRSGRVREGFALVKKKKVDFQEQIFSALIHISTAFDNNCHHQPSWDKVPPGQ